MDDAVSLHKHVDPEELQILLATLLQDTDLMRTAALADKLKVEYFDTSAEYEYRLIWAAMLSFWQNYQKLAPGKALRVEVTRRMDEAPPGHQFHQPYVRERVFKVLESITAVPAGELIPAYAADILKSLLFQRGPAAKLREMAQTGVVTSALWEEVDQLRKSAIINPTPLVMPFAGEDDFLLGVEQSDPCGVSYIDDLVGGGMVRGYCYGYIAPSGAGKTTTANNIMTRYAMRGRRCVVFSYEQEPNARYMIPVYSMTSGVHQSRLKKARSLADLTEDEQKKMRAARDLVKRQLAYVDMSGSQAHVGSGGAAEIDAELCRLEKVMGGPVDAFAIDWFLLMAKRAYNSLHVDYGKKVDARIYYSTLCEELHAICNRHKCWGFITQQASAEEGRKRTILSFEDSAEFKQFAWCMEVCLCQSKMDDKLRAMVSASKVRDAKSLGRIPVTLKPEIATFLPGEDHLTWDNRLGKMVEKDAMNRMGGDSVPVGPAGRDAGRVAL